MRNRRSCINPHPILVVNQNRVFCTDALFIRTENAVGARSAQGASSHVAMFEQDAVYGNAFICGHFSVSTRPLTNQRCISSTTSAGGASASMAVAMIRFQLAAESPPGIMRLIPITPG